MSYQVLARKWRPQRFDEVVGQQAVTRTLRNAIASGRVAQSFVFAGSRGCGKTTTARILARALSCEQGPSADPCGTCDACVEIAQGRDMDVLEIDAASHTGVDNVREVIISGLSIAPVRNRYKVFIIDEVHMLSTSSFNALLKSIEEPPPHVVFMMATTELHKIPDTILSRSQVFEFRSIPTSAIAQQLRKIADAEGLSVSDAALQQVARFAEGSMRDAQSALDQVISFSGTTIADEDIASVLGLVGRDLLLDIVEAVAREDAPAAFALAERAVESGTDLKLVLRELARLTRDLLVLSVDASRARDPEIAPEQEREQLTALAGRFSREDLLRAFDVLGRAEFEMRTSAQPRYHLEMALLKWMHLRKLVPIAELIEEISAGGGLSGAPRVPRVESRGPSLSPSTTAHAPRPESGAPGAPPLGGRPAMPSARPAAPAASRTAAAPLTPPTARPSTPSARAASSEKTSAPTAGGARTENAAQLKDALLAEVRAGKAFFYNTVVAQAHRIEATADQVVFTFLPTHKALRQQFEDTRAWLESAAERLAGRRVSVVSTQAEGMAAGPAAPAPAAGAKAGEKKDDLKAEAMANSAVQGLLEVFPAEIRNVEEM